MTLIFYWKINEIKQRGEKLSCVETKYGSSEGTNITERPPVEFNTKLIKEVIYGAR